MKQRLIYTLSSLVVTTLLTACSGQMTDKMAVVGPPSLSSDPCAVIDQKVVRLDRFTEVVQNTSAFHLEEKAAALTVPGITVSTNRKKMLKDAEKKYAEYAAEHQKYGCESSIHTSTAQMAVVSKAALLSNRCDTIDKKLIKLDEFIVMVNHTSAFHLEEKAAALSVPGITVSNNRKQMLKDAKKKYAEYTVERQAYSCQTPMPIHTADIPDKKEVAEKPVSVTELSADSDKKMMKADPLTTKVNTIGTVDMKEKAVALPAPAITMNEKKEQTLSIEQKKNAELEVESQKYTDTTPRSSGTTQVVEKNAVASTPDTSSDVCDGLDKELIELYEFMIMVKNTSAFHLEEKLQAMPVPGITVSHNKKKMLRDAERKRVELSAERQKQGCKSAEE
ncbi:hypothetical protein [Sulfurovum sp. AR]|uniref:hypothetical protein n=1 Tax=Sulfurovum sp. AR TaxID=1165841 RepID=UPI00025C4B21|nr:hypothetical protein [Sulfurovum sp. AR]EIF50952.1 hypothetical protein SULAR_06273 [Sulfurovum sp. AR]